MVMTIRLMSIEDYEQVYDLWIHTPGMGLNNVDDSRDGIERYLKRNPDTCFAVNTAIAKDIPVPNKLSRESKKPFTIPTIVDITRISIKTPSMM